MISNATPDSLERYFQSFAGYLQSGERNHLSSVFPDADTLSAAAVYRNGFLRGCTEALRSSYPVVDALVGSEYFDHLSEAYIKRHPPRHCTLVDYGEHYPEFLEQQLEQHGLAYLPDFARLDQAWLHAYFAGDARLLREDDIEQWQRAGKAIEQLAACLPASAEMLTLGHCISSTWLQMKSLETPAENTRIEASAEHLLIWRDAQNQVRVRVLNPAEWAFLQPLSGGATLAIAAASALAQDEAFPIIEFFSELLASDLLAVN